MTLPVVVDAARMASADGRQHDAELALALGRYASLRRGADARAALIHDVMEFEGRAGAPVLKRQGVLDPTNVVTVVDRPPLGTLRDTPGPEGRNWLDELAVRVGRDGARSAYRSLPELED